MTANQIIKKYNTKFKVVTKNLSKYFSSEILKLDNLQTVDINHNDLEFLQLKGLLDENLVKPVYLN